MRPLPNHFGYLLGNAPKALQEVLGAIPDQDDSSFVRIMLIALPAHSSVNRFFGHSRQRSNGKIFDNLSAMQ